MSSPPSSNSSVTCQTCKKTFSKQQYYRAHFKYPRNAKCKAVFDKMTVTPQKRSSSESNDCGAAEGNATKSKRFESQSFIEKQVTIANKLVDLLSGEKIEQITQQGSHRADENLDDDQEMVPLDNDSDDEVVIPEDNNQRQEDANVEPDHEIMDHFAQYAREAANNTVKLTPELEAGVELMDLLINKRAPLCLFSAICKWHVNNLNATIHTPRNTLMSKLKERCNMAKSAPQLLRGITLPHSQSKIDLVVHHFRYEVESLLTDPRIGDEDYLFHNNNPFSPPPPDFTTVGDVNTGLAYRKTYEQLVEDPNLDVPLGIIPCMDGAVCGQYDHLPIEALKFTLAIFNAETRDKVHAWRNLGYVTKFLQEDTQARAFVHDSEHIDSAICLTDSEDEDDDSEANENDNQSTAEEMEDEEELLSDGEDEDDVGPQIKSCSGQDLHAMLKAMLSSYKKYEKGFYWAGSTTQRRDTPGKICTFHYVY